MKNVETQDDDGILLILNELECYLEQDDADQERLEQVRATYNRLHPLLTNANKLLGAALDQLEEIDDYEVPQKDEKDQYGPETCLYALRQAVWAACSVER